MANALTHPQSHDDSQKGTLKTNTLGTRTICTARPSRPVASRVHPTWPQTLAARYKYRLSHAVVVVNEPPPRETALYWSS